MTKINAFVFRKAQWPNDAHITPVALSSGIVMNGQKIKVPIRIMSEDEYQLLLAGFIAAGGKVGS